MKQEKSGVGLKSLFFNISNYCVALINTYSTVIIQNKTFLCLNYKKLHPLKHFSKFEIYRIMINYQYS